MERDNLLAKKVKDVFSSRFLRLQSEYQAKWNLKCYFFDFNGNLLNSGTNDESEVSDLPKNEIIQSINESQKWGEPYINITKSSPYVVMFGLPVMINDLVLGGIVAEAPFESDYSVSAAELRKATLEFTQLMEQYNITNPARLHINKVIADKENHRAEAIHEIKNINYKSIREIYLLEEGSLISSIKRGEKKEAVGIINRILVHIYSMSKNRPALLKSFLMELIVTMSRTAVEAGADPSDLLGTNYSAMEQLAQITSDEELSSWVVEMLEKIIEAINKNKIYPNSVLLEKAVRYMHEHLKEDLKRDTVAAQACLSPSHFSKVIKETFGMTYTDLVSKLRVERAKEMLKMTKIPIAQIAFECGFNDQSYFTKVFLKYTKMTPGACRRGR